MPSTNEPTPRWINWLRDWDRQISQPERQTSYMEQELLTLRKRGEPMLYAALMLPFMEQTDLAVKVLRERLNVGGVWLRLVEGAQPPERDPMGDELPDEKKGKVLVAKTGVKGQTADGKPPGSEIDSPAYSSVGRDGLRHRLGQSLYQTKEIGKEPVFVPIADAIVILRQWGVGIAQKYHGRRMQEGKPGRLNWMVEEVPQDEHGQPIRGDKSSVTAPSQSGKRAA
jgi:hypothetical protein